MATIVRVTPGGPRRERGSRKRVARIRLRGNWPNLWALTLTLLSALLLELIHWWAHATGSVVE